MTVGPSSSSTSSATMAFSSPPLLPSPSTSSRPSIQCRRGLIDARQSSGNNASSSGIGSCSGSSSSRSRSSGLRMRTRAAAGVRLAGSGSSAPAHVLTNADLSQLVETNDEWIAQRTGIRCVFFRSFFTRRRRRRLSTTSRSSGRDRRTRKKASRKKHRDSKALSCACSPRLYSYALAWMRVVAIV